MRTVTLGNAPKDEAPPGGAELGPNFQLKTSKPEELGAIFIRKEIISCNLIFN